MGITQIDFEGKNKVERAIELIQAYEPPGGYYLGFSGGKDSMVIYDLAVKAGVKFDAHYCVSPIDPSQIHQFIRENYPAVAWDYHARGFWKTAVKKGLPLRQARWCCEIIKEAGGNDRVKILGMRAAESSKRRGYNCFMKVKNHSDSYWLLPIVRWDDGEVWEYIRVNSLPYCELYNLGFKRLGCVLCPFSSRIDLELKYFPKIVKCWQRAADKIVERQKAANYMTKRGRPLKRIFLTGPDLFSWWITRNK